MHGKPCSRGRLDLHDCTETLKKAIGLHCSRRHSIVSMGVSVHEAPQKLAGYAACQDAADAMTCYSLQNRKTIHQAMHGSMMAWLATLLVNMHAYHVCPFAGWIQAIKGADGRRSR